MITTKILPTRGLVRISGTVPNGNAVIERLTQGQRPFLLRNGTFPVATQGFSLEDSEAPLGIELTYRATITPTNRILQRNLVYTPDFVRGLQSWTVGASRTINTTFDAVSGRTIGTVSSSSTGNVRTIAEVGIAGLVPGQRYLVTGRARFRTPGVWTWQDVKNFGTWQQVRTAKANWAAVRSSVSVPAGDSYATLYFSLALGATEYTVPVKVFENSMASSNQWVDFSMFITAPAGLPGNARLRLLHGSTTREYSITWDLDQFSVYSEADAMKPYRLIWFSGDSEVPDQPQSYLTQEPGWEDISRDSTIVWEGTAGNSVSRFTGPSVIAESVTATINPPGNAPCEPVLLSDPVSTALSQWFSLAKIDGLSREARITVLAVLGRSDFVSTSSMRGSPKGTLTLYTSTLDERKQALAIFESGRILLLRNPNPSYPETSWYLAIGNVEEERTIEFDARQPYRTWTVPFVVVERPTGLIEASSGITWADIKASGMTWRQLRDRRSSWLDVALVDP
jgi:hypothetical protein